MKTPEQETLGSSKRHPGLSARRLRELTDELPRLVACKDRYELSHVTAQILSRYITMTNATFACIEPALGQAYMIHTDEAMGALIDRNLPALFEFQHENDYFQGKLDHHLRQITQTSDWIDDKSFRKTALFNEFFVPAACERQMALIIDSQANGTRISFGVQREGSDYTLQERAVFEFLRPFILAVYDRIVALERTAAALGGLTNFMVQGSSMVIELDPAMQVLRANQAGDAWLKRIGWNKRYGGRLPPVLLTGALAAQPQALDRGHSAKWQVTIERDVFSAEMGWNPKTGTYLLLIDGTSVAQPARDFKALGLTPRQSEILSWIAQGKSNSDIATILGLSVSTVARHVEQIFVRLGVETRTAAAAQAWRVSMPGLAG